MQRHSGRFYAGTKGGGNKEGNENEIRNREEWRGGDECQMHKYISIHCFLYFLIGLYCFIFGASISLYVSHQQ